eukprot:1289798-Rhodomonas_salina.1
MDSVSPHHRRHDTGALWSEFQGCSTDTVFEALWIRLPGAHEFADHIPTVRGASTGELPWTLS